MTESVMAVPHGSPVRGVDSPRASAHAKVKQSVTDRDREIELAGTNLFTRALDVVYSDTADSWIVGESTPSLKALWATSYADRIPADYTPLRVWCRAYRVVAVAVAAPLHILLFLLTHPLRGPITVLITAALVAGVTLR